MDSIAKSFYFFRDHLDNELSFGLEDLAAHTGWSLATVKTYLSKRWQEVLGRSGKQFVVDNLPHTLEEYRLIMSQTRQAGSEQQNSALEPLVESLVTKAQQSAILALDIYNRPGTVFRTEAFIVLMVIAWTALFHAIFEKRMISYFYEDDEGNVKTVDGDEKAWEIGSCMKEYYGFANPPARQNLNFMIKLRNRIEHRFAPEIDPYVGGECQAMLLNFDELLVEEFGERFALQEYLCVPLHTSARRPAYHLDALRRFQSAQYTRLKEYVDDFRRNLEPDVWDNLKFSFRVFLVPKTGNRETSSDLALEFTKHEDLTQPRNVVAVKEVKVPVANPGNLKPGKVVSLVEKRLGKKFNMYNHTHAWRYYGVRGSMNEPRACRTKFCQYDDAHKSHVYTPEWVEFLVFKLSDQQEYEKVVGFVHQGDR